MQEAIKSLSDKAWEIVFLKYYDGMSYEKISAVLGISEQAINGRLRRAKRRMCDTGDRAGDALRPFGATSRACNRWLVALAASRQSESLRLAPGREPPPAGR